MTQAMIDLNRIIQTALGIVVALLLGMVAESYRDLEQTIQENTAANKELLKLHRTWFERSQDD